MSTIPRKLSNKDNLVKNKDEHQKQLENFLEKYTNPAFGSLTKKEIDLLVFEMMLNLGFLTDNMYENQLKLKLTSSKLRSLYYDIELRKNDKNSLNNEIIELLKKPLVVKSGDAFKLEIENPLLKDHIKAKIKSLGHLTDGSFSVDIITLSDKAYFALIEEMISDDEKKEFKKKLIDAGALDTSYKGLLKYASKHLLKRYVGDAGESLIEKSEEEFKSIIDAILSQKSINYFKKLLPNFFRSSSSQ